MRVKPKLKRSSYFLNEIPDYKNLTAFKLTDIDNIVTGESSELVLVVDKVKAFLLTANLIGENHENQAMKSTRITKKMVGTHPNRTKWFPSSLQPCHPRFISVFR